jgi:7-cyano-7-deazaguanine synthase
MPEGEEAVKVLLYSGGLDSYCARLLWQPDVCLYAALGHRYEAAELATIADQDVEVRVDHRLHLGDLERPDGIIPLRNLYLVMLATHHGRTVGLGALAGEVNPDKSPRFRSEAERVLSTCYGESYWSDGEPVRVEYPVAAYTKAQLVRAYLDAGGDATTLVDHTRSCYTPGPIPCGVCSACVKRHIALTLNDLTERTRSDPHTSPYVATITDRWHTYDDTRRRETAAVFPHAVPLGG